MIRIITLNLNHRTYARPVPRSLVDALCDLRPDVLVLTEYVEKLEHTEELRGWLADQGLVHSVTTERVCYRPGRCQNQVLVASRDSVDRHMPSSPAPDACGDTNILICTTFGLRLCGVRAPAYGRASDWYGYWDWFRAVSHGSEVIIGDLNVDPSRARKKDSVLEKLTDSGGLHRVEADGPWSYQGMGNSSTIDHALIQPGLRAERARYIPDPFVPDFTDHAALVVDLQKAA